jgi:hypothetical protein
MGNGNGKPKKANPAQLTDEEIEFLLRNTTFNRSQIIEWHRKFLLDCPKAV